MAEKDDVPVIDLKYAFPVRLHVAADRAIEVLPSATLGPSDGFLVNVAGEQQLIPYRIYNPEPRRTWRLFRSRDVSLITHCIYSRHHEGLVRERHLRSLVSAQRDWVVPYVLQLLGEYVVEILNLLCKRVNALSGIHYSNFAAHNPAFVQRTKSRIVSYWHCYYRSEYPNFLQYPGFVVAESLGWWKPSDLPRLRRRAH